ncbi:MAG: phosphatidylserine decarboxylase family protein, partial [Euryarchaeota archaeon CG01_land_8_20_14_3_00_38_12]
EIGIIRIVQIAGIFARRIVPYIKEGDAVRKGQRIGIIRFGSRVDLYLPKNIEITVKKGENVLSGKTSIGMIK